MRKNPKKCKCGEWMEPVFEEGIGRSYVGAPLIPNIRQEPEYWICPECGNREP
jgi:hypothetical protein